MVVSRPERRRATSSESVGAAGDLLIALGAVAMLAAWLSTVSGIFPVTEIALDDGSIEVPNAPRVLATGVLPAIVFVGLGLWLLGRGEGSRTLGAFVTVVGGLFGAMVVAQVVSGPVGLAAAVAIGIALGGTAALRARIGMRAAVRFVLAALAPVPLAIFAVVAGVVLLQVIGTVVLGEVHSSTGHHSMTASVPYVVLKLVGWVLLAVGFGLLAQRRRPGVVSSSLHVTAGVVLGAGAGEALLGSVRVLVFEFSPLEPPLGIALELLVAALLVGIAIRSGVRLYLVGAGVAFADSFLAFNSTYVSDLGDAGPLAWAVAGAVLALAGAAARRRASTLPGRSVVLPAT